jgi:hypothetical protein
VTVRGYTFITRRAKRNVFRLKSHIYLIFTIKLFLLIKGNLQSFPFGFPRREINFNTGTFSLDPSIFAGIFYYHSGYEYSLPWSVLLAFVYGTVVGTRDLSHCFQTYRVNSVWRNNNCTLTEVRLVQWAANSISGPEMLQLLELFRTLQL